MFEVHISKHSLFVSRTLSVVHGAVVCCVLCVHEGVVLCGVLRGVVCVCVEMVVRM